MFLLAETLHSMLQISVLRLVQQRFHGFLQTLPEDFHLPRQIISQVALLCVRLIPRKQYRHHRNAHDQGQDDFEGCAHRFSSPVYYDHRPRQAGYTRPSSNYRLFRPDIQ